MSEFIMGVDLGQTTDYTAVTVLEVTQHDTGKRQPVGSIGSISYGLGGLPRNTSMSRSTVPVYENTYVARHLERFPMGTPYPKQVERIKARHDWLTDAKHKLALVMDQTGVGRPVVDMLRAAGLKPDAVTITAGDSVTREGRDFRVPKRDLVSVAQVLLQSKRLEIVRSLAEAQTLIDELLAFKVSINTRGHDSYGNDVGEWRENPHDDLVLAVALACWHGENVKPPVLTRSRSFTSSGFA